MECGGPRDSEGDREVQHAGPAGRGVLAEFPAAMPPAAERVAGGPRGGARIRKDCSKQVARLCPHPSLGRIRPTQGLVPSHEL